MKWLRVLLLVLLSITLPVRGVMAAALLCPSHASAAGQAHAAPAAHAGGSVQHAGAADAAEAADTAEAGDTMAPPCHSQDANTATDTCHLCSACCSVPPMPSAALVLPQPQELAASAFPPCSAPAPTFQAEGPERPPRSI